MSVRLPRRSLDTNLPPAALGLGSTVVALVGVSLWAAVVARVFGAVPNLPRPLVTVSAATSLVGLAGGGVAYARLRGFDVGLGAPRAGSWPTAVAAAVGPAALAGAAAVVGNALGAPLSEATHLRVAPDVSASVLVVAVLAPAALVGAGYAVLLAAVVVESVRALVAPDDVGAVAALVAGYVWLLPTDLVARLPLGVGAAVELVATLVFGVAFGVGLGVARSVGLVGKGKRSSVSRRDAAILAVAGLGVVGAATDVTSAGEAVASLLWLVAVGATVVGYHRTRSVWVAVAGLAGFSIALRVVAYAEAALGLVTL